MKKLFALLMAVCIMLVSSAAIAENSGTDSMSKLMSKLNSNSEVDLSAMTEDELLGLIDSARAELSKTVSPIGEGDIFYEDENIRITINSEPYIEYSTLTFDVIVENLSSFNLNVRVENCKINGWYNYGTTVSVSANGKTKTTLDFYDVTESAYIDDASELQEIIGIVNYYDTDSYDDIYTSDTLYWLFGEVAAAADSGADLSNMTEEELWNIITSARMELGKYDPIIAEGEVFYEDENIRITLINAPYIEYESLTLDVIIENFSSHNLIVSIEDCKINGWDHYGASVSLVAGSKIRTTLGFYDVVESCELSDVSELQDIVGVISYFDSDTYDDIFTSDTYTWTFGE